MNYIAIIPALKKNRHSDMGDLHPWGGTTLLEWKISQVKKISNIKKVFVATYDKKIIDLCKKLKVPHVLKKSKSSLSNFHFEIAKKFKNKNLIFFCTTSPFLSSTTIIKILKKHKQLNKNYDSLCTVNKNDDYFFYRNNSINFDYKKESISRRSIKPLIKLTNGMHIINSSLCANKKSIIGDKPYFYKLDWMSGLEINSLKDIEIYNLLINYYYKKIK